MTLTIEEIRMLADLERRMDSGEQPYVIIEGHRAAVTPLVMDEFGLESGQTVSKPIFLAMLEANLANLRALQALKDA